MTTPRICSFCARSHDQAEALVPAIDGSVAICDRCIDQAMWIILQMRARKQSTDHPINAQRLALGGSITTDKGDKL